MIVLESNDDLSLYILKKLKAFINLDIEARKEHKILTLRKRKANFNYHKLIFYIKNNVLNQNIDQIVIDLLKFDAEYFMENVINYYYDKCGLDVKKKIEDYIYNKLNDKFDYNMYLCSIEKNMEFSFDSIYVENLEEYIDEKYLDLQKVNDKNNDLMMVFRTVFFVNYVTHKLPFVFKYLHKISNEMDFLIEQGKFDFEKFDVKWLSYYRTPIQLKLLALNEEVKPKIKDRIIEYLGHDYINYDLKEFLLNVLTGYFK